MKDFDNWAYKTYLLYLIYLTYFKTYFDFYMIFIEDNLLALMLDKNVFKMRFVCFNFFILQHD